MTHQPIPSIAATILDGIRRWVEIETPTEAPAQVNKLVDHGRRGLSRSACHDRAHRRTRRLRRSSGGAFGLGPGRAGHSGAEPSRYRASDGFIERLPFKIDGDSAFGPGIYDMKGGAYLAYHAFRQLCAGGERPPLGITHLYVSDEEIGSPTSRALIEAEGRKAKYVLVTEPARDGGKIVTGRKGVARFEVFIKGVPAHAGTRPQDGRSAIRELGQCHPDAGSDERCYARHHRQCRRRQRRHQAQRDRGRGLCRSRPARADDRGCRRARCENPRI